MNARQWSRRRSSRWQVKGRPFRRRRSWDEVWTAMLQRRAWEWVTPEDAYWSATVWCRCEGTPEEPDGPYAYRLRDGTRGGYMRVMAVDSAWQEQVLAFVNGGASSVRT